MRKDKTMTTKGSTVDCPVCAASKAQRDNINHGLACGQPLHALADQCGLPQAALRRHWNCIRGEAPALDPLSTGTGSHRR
jgi:hypothetical protein